MAKHEENEDLRRLSRIAKIDTVNRVIKINPSANIGIRTWGRIDFLTKYKGWFFNISGVTITKDNEIFTSSDNKDNKLEKRLAKHNKTLAKANNSEKTKPKTNKKNAKK